MVDERWYIREIDFVMRYAGEIRRQVNDAREELMIRARRDIGMRNSSRVADPTASLAISNLTYIKKVMVRGHEVRKPELWLEVVGLTRRWSKRRGLEYEEALKWYDGARLEEICARLSASRGHVLLILERVRNYAAIQAAYRKLIKLE